VAVCFFVLIQGGTWIMADKQFSAADTYEQALQIVNA
jgi:hypothetical protein